MSVLTTLPLLWGQATEMPQPSKRLMSTLSWFFVYGEPSVTVNGFWGAPLTWLKVVSLFCLVAWAGGWVIAAIKERAVKQSQWLNVAALIAVIVSVVAMLVR